jgi:hypothetical protein
MLPNAANARKGSPPQNLSMALGDRGNTLAQPFCRMITPQMAPVLPISGARDCNNRLVTARYLNVLTVCLRGYDGHPSPENLIEEFSLAVSVGGGLDLGELASAIETDDLAGGTRRVRQSLTESSWGASGSTAEVLIDVPAWLSGLASVPVLWDAVSRRVLRVGKARPVTAEACAEAARSMLARSLNVGTAEIRVTGIEPIEHGSRVELDSLRGPFAAEVGSNGVTRLSRLSG